MTIRNVPDGDTSWGSDIRAMIARINDLGDTVGNPIPVARVGTNAGGTVNFLRADGVFAAPPTGGSSGGGSIKAWEDANRAIAAKGPSSESGLTAAAINNSTDDAPRYQAMINYLQTTYGGGTLYVPAGRSRMLSGITIPQGVMIRGNEMAIWDFWDATDGITAINVAITDDQLYRYTVIDGLTIQANQYDTNTDHANTTTKTGLKVSGNHLNFNRMRIYGFNWGIDIKSPNTYILSFDQCQLALCKVGINADIGNSFGYNPAGASANSGERIVFSNGLISNGGLGFAASASGLSMYFVNSSIDYTRTFGRIRDAHVFFDNCHLESGYVGTGTGGGTPNPYLFQMDFASRFTMSNTNLVIGTPGGIYYVIDPTIASPGWYAQASFNGCHAYYTVPAGASSAKVLQFSENVVDVPTGATTITVVSPFVTKWNTMKVNVVAWNGQPAANVTARITAIDHTLGTLTITLSGAAPANTWIEVDC